MIAQIDVRDVIRFVASGHTWVRETAGSNRGEVVDRIARVCGFRPEDRLPWCMMYVGYIGQLALGRYWPVPKFGGCAQMGDWLRARGVLRADPAPGAIFLQWRDGARPRPRFGHAGFALDPMDDGRWQTNEGNTNEGGSPEGTGVFERARTWQPKDRFGYWWLL